MQFSQANVASIMMLISEKKITIEDSIGLMNVVNDRCSKIMDDVKFKDEASVQLAKHFLTKWLINYNNAISDDDLQYYASQLKRGNPTPYRELTLCSLVEPLTLVNRFMMTLYASGTISDFEMTDLSGEYSSSLKSIYSDVLDSCAVDMKDESTKLLILHMAERSLTQNLSQYFKTVLEQGLVDQFLDNPLTMFNPLRLQVKKEVDLAINLAKKVINN